MEMLKNKIEKIIFKDGLFLEFKNYINYNNWVNVNDNDLIDYIYYEIKNKNVIDLKEEIYCILDDAMQLEIVINDGKFNDYDYQLIYIGKTEYAIL